MSISLGATLAKKRKEAGLSQEEVAEQIGVSRQAVSRWENGEASPDTDNLVALAKLYNVSLDELVGLKEEAEAKLVDDEDKFEENKEDNDNDDDDDDEDDDDEKVKSPSMRALSGLLSIAGVVAYLIVGFTWKTPEGGPVGWASMWVLLFAAPLIMSIFRVFRLGKMKAFAIPLLVVGVYCGMGIIGNFYGKNFWHPYWIEFFAIPVYYTIAGFVDAMIKEKR